MTISRIPTTLNINECFALTQGGYILSKRKTGALREEQKYSNRQTRHSDKTFYSHESKTIDFLQAHKEFTKISRKPIQLIPKSVNQEKYIIALSDPTTDIVVVTGPAGTGKTYLAMLAAIKEIGRAHV